MKASKFKRFSLIVCLALSALEISNSQVSTRILFIGNSFTMINGGLDKQLKGLAPSTETVCIAAGGYTLEKHWTDGNAARMIREGKWDYVVLQEQSQIPVINQKKFYDYARKFDEEIRRSGAKTILLMTWERPDSRKIGVTTENLAASYLAVGKELDVKVAPAGLSFARSIRGKPELVCIIRTDIRPWREHIWQRVCFIKQYLIKVPLEIRIQRNLFPLK